MDTSIQENFWDETCFAFVLQLILSYNKNKVDYLPWLRTTWLIKTKIPNPFLNSILDSPSWSLYLFSLPSTFQILSLVNGWPFLIVLLNGYKCGSWYCNCSHFTTLINISNSIYQSKGLFFRYLKHVTVGQAVHHVFFWLCTWWISSSWRFFVAYIGQESSQVYDSVRCGESSRVVLSSVP